METYGLSRETIRAYLADEGSGSGLGPDALSAYSDYAADFLYPMDDSGQMFPGGNAGIARMITKTLIPDAIAGEASVEGVARGAVNFAALDRAGQTTRIRLNSTAVWVEHEGVPEKSEFVTIAYARERQGVSGKGAVGDHGRRLLDDEAHCEGPAGGATRSIRAVLSIAVPDGECGSAELAVSLQQGYRRMPLVWRAWELHQRATDGDVRPAAGDHQSGFADGADDQTYLFVPGYTDGAAGSARAIRDAGHALCGI